MNGNDLIPFLLGIAWPQYLKLQEQHQKLHAGPGQGPGAGAPMGELSPEVAGILQMLMGQGGDPTGAPQPPAQPSPPLPPRIGPDSQNGLPPIPGARPAMALPPSTSSSPTRPILPAAA